MLDQLFRQPETTAALLDAIAEKRISAAALSLEQIAALRGHAVEAIRTRATELLADAGASPDPERQKVLAELLAVADAAGDAAHGKELFTKHCAVCHMHSGVGETIAPDLTGMFVHPKKDILGNIIDPSRDVESNFRTYSVISNGLAYNGMFAGESRTTVTLIDSAGKRTVIQRDEIDEIYASEKSLMPDGFENLLSRSDLSDVLEFLATPQRFVPLRLSTVATTSSVPQFGGRGQDGRGRGGRRRGDRGRGGLGGRRFALVALDDWKPRTVNDVPFSLIDPVDGAVKNLLLFGSEDSFFARGLPTAVRLPCGMAAKSLHLLWRELRRLPRSRRADDDAHRATPLRGRRDRGPRTQERRPLRDDPASRGRARVAVRLRHGRAADAARDDHAPAAGRDRRRRVHQGR